jgi:transcriptional regulator with XRE-family HTH domain
MFSLTTSLTCPNDYQAQPSTKGSGVNFLPEAESVEDNLMGHSRPRPGRLAEKLRQIRNTFGLSQTELHRRLGVEDLIVYNEISKYESDDREPPLMVLLQYARVAGINMEVLADDELDLPERLPGQTNHAEIRRRFASRRKSRR